MGKVVILDLEQGNFEQGFQVNLEIGEDGKPFHIRESGSRLPKALKVALNYDKWREKYRRLEAHYRLELIDEEPEQITSEEKVIRIGECRESLESLKKILNQWLATEGFRPIEKELLTALNPSDEIRVIIRAKDSKLRQLPWDAWEFFYRFPNAAVAISTPDWKKIESINRKDRVKILAILGHSGGINIEEDRNVIEHLPQADVTFLKEPQRKELEHLWQQHWDILFFAGHSHSKEGEQGFIYLNKTEKLSISELKEALEEAIKNGLQLAIFNSCDGLGIGYELRKLNIPQVIAMREPVPDEFAQKFLRYFLESLSRGKSLYAAVRQARGMLHELSDIEKKFPGASLLPVIFQNPGVLPVKWQDFLQEQTILPSIEPLLPLPQSRPKFPLGKIVIGGVGSAILLSLIGYWWFTKPLCSFSDIRAKWQIDIPQGQRFKYGGSTSVLPFSKPFYETIKQTLPTFDLDNPNYSGSLEGIEQVLQGTLDFSLSSATPSAIQLQKAQQQGYTLSKQSVAIDAIAVGVNPQLNIRGLTLTQLKGIYTGRIRNWQELGGANLPIIPYSRKSEVGGTVQYFINDVLNNESFNPKVVQFVDSTTRGLNNVGANLGGIYYASASELVPQCEIKPLPLKGQQGDFISPYQGNYVLPESCPKQRNQINLKAFESGDYPITRNIFVIIKDFEGEKNPDEKAGKTYAELLLTGKGQAIVKNAGFVPVRYSCPSP